jgi:predicted nucleotidyltransferase component of viral defense system
MNTAVETMLERYKCQSEQDYVNALKEIMQEVALLGLWRAKFFEHAAFYGGTALRILYKLDRFSEDLDFSLLRKEENFKLSSYLGAIQVELESLGFGVTVEEKKKSVETAIESAFIKAGTKEHLLKIEVPRGLTDQVQHNAILKIKLEVDTDPPGKFETEAKTLLLPIPFAVNTLKLPDLFAGKIHALLERDYKTRVKGRDHFDFVWYVARNTPVRLEYLHEKLKQSGKWSSRNGWSSSELLTVEKLQELLARKFSEIDFELAKKDVAPFIKDQDALKLWNAQFFSQLSTGVDGV